MYGANEETYERVTGRSDSFLRCRRGIELLMERKIPLDLKTVVMTLNKDELHQMKTFAEQLGLRFRFDPAVTPRLDGSKTPCQFRLLPQEVVALDMADDERASEWRKEFKKPVEWFHSDKLFPCVAGLTIFHIDPYGKMSICEMCRFHTYDLRSGSFRDGWDGNIPLLLEVRRETDSPCHTCPWKGQCNQCPGWAWAENGDLEAPVAYNCEITRLRASMFG